MTTRAAWTGLGSGLLRNVSEPSAANGDQFFLNATSYEGEPVANPVVSL